MDRNSKREDAEMTSSSSGGKKLETFLDQVRAIKLLHPDLANDKVTKARCIRLGMTSWMT